MLSAADELEERGRTEEQIKARVKKLGLTKVSKSPPSSAISNGVVEQPDRQGQEDPEQENPSGEDEGKAGDGDHATTVPARLRKIERRGQESDADSEGLFTSAEVN